MVTVESWLWNPGYGIKTGTPAVESWLGNRDCGILAVEFLQLPGNGFLAWESWLWLPSGLLGSGYLAKACRMWIPGLSGGSLGGLWRLGWPEAGRGAMWLV